MANSPHQDTKDPNNPSITQSLQPAQQQQEDEPMDATPLDFDKMTIDEKKKLVQDYRHDIFIKLGTYVNAVDTTQQYLLSRVVSVNDQLQTAVVNFDGWPSKWNSTVRWGRILPLLTKNKGYSGQKKVAIRNGVEYTLEKSEYHLNFVKELIEKDFDGLSAHSMTQYLSGELFTYVDGLLGYCYNLPDENDLLQKTMELTHEVMRLITYWLKKIPTLTKTLQEMDAIPNLFLVDPKAAIVESYTEILETLGKFFGNCSRALHFFSFYDFNQIDPATIKPDQPICANSFGIVVQDFMDLDFENSRQTDQQLYSDQVSKGYMKDRKDLHYGNLLNWVQYFAELGGFDAVLTALNMGLNEEKSTKLPFQITTQIAKVFRKLNKTLTPEFSQKFSELMGDAVQKRLTMLTEAEIKNCQKDQIDLVVFDLEKMLMLGLDNQESYKRAELTNLNVGLRYLKSQQLEKRIRGLQDIRYMIDRVWKTKNLHKLKYQNNYQQWQQGQEILFDADNDITKLRATGYLTPELMSQWLIDNKVFELIFGDTSHIEIVKRANVLLMFMARHHSGQLDPQIIELTWKYQDGTHVEMVRTIYGLIEQMLPDLGVAGFDYYFNKMQMVTVFDEKFLNFLKNFTIRALEKQYEIMNDEHDPECEDTFDFHLQKKEEEMVDKIQQNIKTVNFNSMRPQYGLPIFWRICQDNSTESKETREFALTAICTIFVREFRRTHRLHYLCMALNEMQNNRSLYQCCRIVKAVITSYTIDQENQMTHSYQQPSLIQILQEKIQILDHTVELIKNYHSQVKQELKKIENQQNLDIEMNESGSSPYSDSTVFVGKYPHRRTLKTMLNQIKFLLTDVYTCLGLKNIELLWQLFVEQPNFSADQTMFLSWINRSKQEHIQKNPRKPWHEMFSEEERKHLFLMILCPQVQKPGSTYQIIKCFQTFFLQVNKAEHAIQVTRRFKVVDFNKLLGLEALKEIAIKHQDKKSRELVQELLINVYLKQSEVKKEHIYSFVDICMESIQSGAPSEGVVPLLSQFLDRYEGVKEPKIDLDLQQRLKNYRSIQVTNLIDVNNPQQKVINLYYYQSMGFLRNLIADTFALYPAEFHIFLKNNNYIDPEIDDDKFMRDFQGQFQPFLTIRRNDSFKPDDHPKLYLSQKVENFEAIFNLLKTAPVSQSDQIYALFSKLPVNPSLKEKFLTLSSIKSAKTSEEKDQAWKQLLDCGCFYHLLYCVSIINGIISQEQEKWLNQFIELGGLKQLLVCLLNLNISEIDSMLKLKCLKDVIQLVIQQVADQRCTHILGEVDQLSLFKKLITFVELLCDFSIMQEKKRGFSFEQLQKKIRQEGQKKFYAKLHQVTNAKEKDKLKQNEDEDADTEDLNTRSAINDEFKQQYHLAKDLFVLIQLIARQDPIKVVNCLLAKEFDFIPLCRKGLLETENFFLRTTISNKMVELMFPDTTEDHMQVLVQNGETKRKLILSMFSLVKEEYKELRCSQFFYNLVEMIKRSNDFLDSFKEEAIKLIQELTIMIRTSKIVENTKTDIDFKLQGLLNLMAILVAKYPYQKSQVGSDLLQYLLHDCLFEIPQGSKGIKSETAPKCKQSVTRKSALALVNVLSRDNLLNLSSTLNYLTHFNKEATWRTNKDSDWSIKIYDDEKSSTGHVGIKNLACICYMNSLNQQLFMIPSFRNDILSIKDPNHENQPDEDNFFLQWQNLFTGLQMSQKQYVNPKAYCHSYKDYDGQPVNVIEQKDVEEYMNQLFDKLETAIKGTPQAKTIQYHFGGALANEIICKTCPHQYERIEPFLSIGVSVKNKKSIVEGLETFVSGDMLDADNQYQCEKCDKKVDALKRACIKTLPRYLIASLKRFEFDFDTMMRVKVNDFYEFPHTLDMTNFTQEYLQKKAKGNDFQMKHPTDYYNYELVGIVVHSGTADSGHYYSYIKEQERFSEDQPEKWYEFNDTLVQDFDHQEIPSECFGGVEEMMYGKKYERIANAYLCVYKRKMEDNPPDSDDESTEQQEEKPLEKLGQKSLNLDPESQLVKKTAQSNHKYWQNRFLFSQEYSEFACQLTAQWNSSKIIPLISLDRNDDNHLDTFYNTVRQNSEDRKQQVQFTIDDQSIDLTQFYKAQEISDAEASVFKFAASHYVSIMQRSESKTYLPEMSRYLKSYMNYRPELAKWFLSQFINQDLIRESFMENNGKPMRMILGGLIYCAMLKTFELEKADLMSYWTDYQLEKVPIRQTVLGNFMLLLIYMLPKFYKYNKNHSAIFQLIARFTALGAEARAFLCQADGIERLLNYFYWECSPYLQEFQEYKRLPFDLTEEPEIGLPTPESLEKKGNFAMLKRKMRLQKQHTDEPNHRFLVEAVANLARAIKNQKNVPTIFMLDNAGAGSLSERAQVVWLPNEEFIEKLFLHATKPFVLKTLCHAYMHHAMDSETTCHKLYKTVNYGCNAEYEHTKIRPFFMLYFWLIQLKTPFIEKQFDLMMTQFISKVLLANRQYFQWMESAIEFIWKLYTRIPKCQQWFVANTEKWENYITWCDQNKTPPMYSNQLQQFQSKGVMRLNKGRMMASVEKRYDSIHNQTLHFQRMTYLNKMKSGEAFSLKDEYDLDSVDCQNYKFRNGEKVVLVKDRHMPVFKRGTIVQDIDEIIQVRVEEANGEFSTFWQMTHQNKLYPESVVLDQHRVKEITRISEIVRQRYEEEQKAREQQMRLRNEQQSNDQQRYFSGSKGFYRNQQDDDDDDDDVEDDDDEMNEGQRVAPAIDNDDENRADSTEQNYDETQNENYEFDVEADPSYNAQD